MSYTDSIELKMFNREIPVMRCSCCSKEMYYGDQLVIIGGKYGEDRLCEECADEYIVVREIDDRDFEEE